MSGIDLTTVQRRTLETLVDRFKSTGSPVTSDDLADTLDRTPQTIRNHMQGLRDLGLVRSVIGPGGGYRPTGAAYDLLGRTNADDPESVVVAREYDRVSVTVDGITFTNVHHPDSCMAWVRFRESPGAIAPGDAILVGPTPVGDLVAGGTVEAVDKQSAAVYLNVVRLEAPVTPES